MEFLFNELTALRLAQITSSQAIVEGELPIPTGRENCVLLSSTGSVTLYNSAVVDNAVVIEGRVVAEVLCRDGDELFSFSSAAAFRHNVLVDGAKDGMKAKVQVSINTLNIEGSSSLTLYAVLDIECSTFYSSPQKMLAGIRGADDFECMQFEQPLQNYTQLTRSRLRLREEFNLPGAVQVISVSYAAQPRDIQTGGDTAIADATFTLTTLSVGEQGRIFQTVSHLPVTLNFPLDRSVKEVGGVSHKLHGVIEIESLEVLPTAEDGVFTMETDIIFTLDAPVQTNSSLLVDAYSPSCALEATKEPLMLYTEYDRLSVKHSMSETLLIPEGMPESYRVVYASARPLTTSCNMENGRLTVNGLLFAKIVYSTEDDNLYTFTEDVPFYCETQQSEIADAVPVCESTTLLYATASGAGRSVEMSFALHLDVRPHSIVNAEVVTGMKEKTPMPEQRGLIIYFASSGETLFDVAKRFNVSKSRITGINPNVNETLRDGERLLLQI